MVESDTTGVMKDKIARYCFANLASYLKDKTILKPPAEFDSHKYPLFVTW